MLSADGNVFVYSERNNSDHNKGKIYIADFNKETNSYDHENAIEFIGDYTDSYLGSNVQGDIKLSTDQLGALSINNATDPWSDNVHEGRFHGSVA